LGYEQQIKGIISNLPSGYNRDYQETKRGIMQGFELINQMIKVTTIVLKSIEPIEENLKKGLKPEIYATDIAYRMVKEGKPFRDAYREVGNNLDKIKPEDPVENIKSKQHIGATGNLMLDYTHQELIWLSDFWKEKQHTFQSILTSLLEKRPLTCEELKEDAK
jgi:argininosuccinate lyase